MADIIPVQASPRSPRHGNIFQPRHLTWTRCLPSFFIITCLLLLILCLTFMEYLVRWAKKNKTRLMCYWSEAVSSLPQLSVTGLCALPEASPVSFSSSVLFLQTPPSSPQRWTQINVCLETLTGWHQDFKKASFPCAYMIGSLPHGSPTSNQV